LIENRLTFVCTDKHTEKLLGSNKVDLGHYYALLFFGKWKVRRAIDMHIANVAMEAIWLEAKWIDEYLWSYVHELCHDLNIDFHGREECELL